MPTNVSANGTKKNTAIRSKPSSPVVTIEDESDIDEETVGLDNKKRKPTLDSEDDSSGDEDENYDSEKSWFDDDTSFSATNESMNKILKSYGDDTTEEDGSSSDTNEKGISHSLPPITEIRRPNRSKAPSASTSSTPLNKTNNNKEKQKKKRKTLPKSTVSQTTSSKDKSNNEERKSIFEKYRNGECSLDEFLENCEKCAQCKDYSREQLPSINLAYDSIKEKLNNDRENNSLKDKYLKILEYKFDVISNCNDGISIDIQKKLLKGICVEYMETLIRYPQHNVTPKGLIIIIKLLSETEYRHDTVKELYNIVYNKDLEKLLCDFKNIEKNGEVISKITTSLKKSKTCSFEQIARALNNIAEKEQPSSSNKKLHNFTSILISQLVEMRSLVKQKLRAFEDDN
ncbi:hypothetical protein ABK040_006697 [Willaertia magna]